MRPFQHSALIGAALIVSTVSFRTAATEPTVADSVPDRWMYISEHIQTLPTDDRWWQQLQDPLLDSLIVLGVERNFNLAAAMHRIGAARQAINSSKALYYPTVRASAGWTKNRSSGDMTPFATGASTIDYFSLGAQASWEVDLFGRVTAQVKQKKALYNASRADYAATMVSLSGEIARNYAMLRTYQSELAVAREHMVMQDSVLHIAMHRHEAGIASELDVAQAATIYYSTKATIPGLEASASSAINAIAVLLGEYPDAVRALLDTPGKLPRYDVTVGAGLPADLIRRRPDIVAAEYQLAASAMSIGIAKKDFLPVISLQGSIGTSAHRVKNMFSKESLTYSVAPTVSWTVFDGLGRRAAVESAREEMKASVEQYNMAVLTAMQEVDDAMLNYSAALRQVEALEEVVKRAEEAFTLALDLYRSGLTSFTNVADAQISFLQYSDSLAAAKGSALSALVSLYASLSGGWNEPK